MTKQKFLLRSATVPNFMSETVEKLAICQSSTRYFWLINFTDNVIFFNAKI